MKKLTAMMELIDRINTLFSKGYDDAGLRTCEQLATELLAKEREQHGQTWDAAIQAHEDRGHVVARSIVDFDDYYSQTFNHA